MPDPMNRLPPAEWEDGLIAVNDIQSEKNGNAQPGLFHCHFLKATDALNGGGVEDAPYQPLFEVGLKSSDITGPVTDQLAENCVI